MAMRVARSLGEWPRVVEGGNRAVVSVGNFDGLHIGHQRILETIVDRARAENALAAVITFDPHPMKVLRPQNAPPLIMTLGDRLAGFERMGIDACLVLPFTEALAKLPAEEFVKSVLVDSVRACKGPSRARISGTGTGRRETSHCLRNLDAEMASRWRSRHRPRWMALWCPARRSGRP